MLIPEWRVTPPAAAWLDSRGYANLLRLNPESAYWYQEWWTVHGYLWAPQYEPRYYPSGVLDGIGPLVGVRGGMDFKAWEVENDPL